MALTITIPDPEADRLTAWKRDHDEKVHHGLDVTAIGGRYTLEITSTSIGTVFKVRCACGAKEDVTEYDNW